ncbi:type III secretion apparatus protein RspB [Pseudomonas fluorescens]|uniref:type III secretion apparatus protein RspB n=1 Tax=Pseudomonas fluorescens TaxID=294 RepID=UPI001FCEB905|nr:type III secretion apparatus protein RspB [Pseudomonas fluorescens]
MQIESLDSSFNFKERVPTGQARDHSTLNTDFSFFSSQLESPASFANGAASRDSTTLLSEATKALDVSKSRITNSLNSLKKGLDVEKLRTFPLELSNQQLTSQLLVKSLAKTTQCIEKISNLQ